MRRLAFRCSLANLIKPIDGWPMNVIDEFRSRLTTTFLFAKFIYYNEVRDISEVEITEKASKISFNKDFRKIEICVFIHIEIFSILIERYQMQRLIIPTSDKLLYKCMLIKI